MNWQALFMIFLVYSVVILLVTLVLRLIAQDFEASMKQVIDQTKVRVDTLQSGFQADLEKSFSALKVDLQHFGESLDPAFQQVHGSISEARQTIDGILGTKICP